MNIFSPSLLKKHYSSYVSTYRETPLLSFDSESIAGLAFFCAASTDTQNKREGAGSLRLVTDAGFAQRPTKLLWGDGGESFRFAVKDRHKTTLKLWLYVENVDDIICDHDSIYGEQLGEATFFFRVLDRAGRPYCWNHTLRGNGWHEVELTFNVHNGIGAGFDYEDIISFGMLVQAKEGAVIGLDDLRLVEYTTSHQSCPLPAGDRLITDGEYDALDGAVVQEWYGCSYDQEDAFEGRSSLRVEGDASVNDFRCIVACLDIPMRYREDVLVLALKVEEFDTLRGLFIELNEEQDVHEYERVLTMDELRGYGLDREGEWCRVAVPLDIFKQNFCPTKYGTDENITLHNFRLCALPRSGRSYVLHADLVYLTTKAALGWS